MDPFVLAGAIGAASETIKTLWSVLRGNASARLTQKQLDELVAAANLIAAVHKEVGGLSHEALTLLARLTVAAEKNLGTMAVLLAFVKEGMEILREIRDQLRQRNITIPQLDAILEPTPDVVG